MIFKKYKDALDYSVMNPSETVEYTSYFKNGQLEDHGFYVNGLLHGECKEYYSDGNLYVHCFFVNGEDVNVDHLNDGSYKSLCILSTLFNGNVFDEDI